MHVYSTCAYANVVPLNALKFTCVISSLLLTGGGCCGKITPGHTALNLGAGALEERGAVQVAALPAEEKQRGGSLLIARAHMYTYIMCISCQYKYLTLNVNAFHTNLNSSQFYTLAVVHISINYIPILKSTPQTSTYLLEPSQWRACPAFSSYPRTLPPPPPPPWEGWNGSPDAGVQRGACVG